MSVAPAPTRLAPTLTYLMEMGAMRSPLRVILISLVRLQNRVDF
jgi:hypothetical protein